MFVPAFNWKIPIQKIVPEKIVLVVTFTNKQNALTIFTINTSASPSSGARERESDNDTYSGVILDLKPAVTCFDWSLHGVPMNVRRYSRPTRTFEQLDDPFVHSI